MRKHKLPNDPFAKREANKYANPIPSREFIISYIEKEEVALSRNKLAQLLDITTPFEKEAFRRRLRAMVRDGQLVKSRTGKYRMAKSGELLRGRVIGHKNGYGFVAPEDGTSHIFLPSREMYKVLDGDLALIRVVDINRDNQREGIIVKIIEHKLQQIVGRFLVESNIGFVEPDNKRISQGLFIPPENQLNAKSGQIVIAKIETYSSTHLHHVGRIIEVLGDYMAPGMEIEVAMRSQGIPHQWSEEALEETQQIPNEITEDDLKDRIDLRHKPLVTIDGEDAKDFDDAIFCEKRLKNGGGWHLLVAIADVTHYVKPNSALDRDANERGNSVYFPGHVIPMLPKVLSNDLCSLNPRVDRLCMVCDMIILPTGKIKQYRFYPAVMRSHARLTYTKVANLLADKNPKLIKQYQHLMPFLKNAHQLFQVLYKRRCKRGALNFETPEIKVEFGAKRKIKKLYPTIRNDAHKLIEECMLCANVCAANFLIKRKCDALFRIHDGAKSDKFANLKIFLGELGLKLGGGDLPKPTDYAKLIDQIQDRPDAHLIQTVLLRSLTQAFYSPQQEGHFALAYDAYTHFTSPIRRYPDITVHRAIKSTLKNEKKKLMLDFEALQVLGEHCSMTERRADDATREAITWLKCEYMLDKLGNEFEGVISKVTGFGFFIELRNIFVEGLAHITTLPKDYYIFDPIRHRLIGERSGKIYRIGDLLKIKVARVDLTNKEIDFSII